MSCVSPIFADHDTKSQHGDCSGLWITCNSANTGVNGIVSGTVGCNGTRGFETLRCKDFGQVGVVRVVDCVYHPVFRYVYSPFLTHYGHCGH